MANVFDVAKYILEKKGEMSTMKLQKLCYYAQAWALVWDDKPLFTEDFQAWANGPVCPELFFKTQGIFSVSAKDETGGENNLTDNEKDTIDKVIDYYGDKNAQWLSQLTHMEDPWNYARIGVPAGIGCDHVITKESMAMYYGAYKKVKQIKTPDEANAVYCSDPKQYFSVSPTWNFSSCDQEKWSINSKEVKNAQEIFDEIQSDGGMEKLWKSYQKKFSYAANIPWETIMESVRELYFLLI